MGYKEQSDIALNGLKNIIEGSQEYRIGDRMLKRASFKDLLNYYYTMEELANKEDNGLMSHCTVAKFRLT